MRSRQRRGVPERVGSIRRARVIDIFDASHMALDAIIIFSCVLYWMGTTQSFTPHSNAGILGSRRAVQQKYNNTRYSQLRRSLISTIETRYDGDMDYSP